MTRDQVEALVRELVRPEALREPPVDLPPATSDPPVLGYIRQLATFNVRSDGRPRAIATAEVHRLRVTPDMLTREQAAYLASAPGFPDDSPSFPAAAWQSLRNRR